MSPATSVELTINERVIKIHEGATILEAAWTNRIDIPALCHTQGLAPVGACRLCMVQVEGSRTLVPACIRKTEAGMKVHTNTDEIKSVRKTLLELLLADHPEHCLDRRAGQEDGKVCELEGLAEKCGVTGTRYPRRKEPPAPDISSHSIHVNHAACILCDRCVRACAREEHFVIARKDKGPGASIAFGWGEEMYSSGCTSCGACVDVCPTGALTEKATSIHAHKDHDSDEEELLNRGDACSTDELKQYPIFQHVSEKFLKRNCSSVVRRRIGPGKTLFREGEPGRTAFYIIDGVIDVETKNGVRHLGPDNLVGEMSCINLYPRLATATVSPDAGCEVLEMLRTALEVVRNNMFRAPLDENYCTRALDDYMKKDEIFALLPEKVIQGLCDKVKLVRYGPGKTIYKEKEKADALYFIALGFVRVSRKYQGGDFVLTYLSPGSSFGEMALLDEKIHHATCSTLHHVDLVRIDAGDFEEIMAGHPEIHQKLKAKVAKRTEENRERWSQITRLRVDKVDQPSEFLHQGLLEAQSMLVLDLDKCTRCDQCVIACANTHDGIPRLVRDGLRFGHYLVTGSCRHCHDPLCMVCHWNAISRDPKNKSLAVVIDPNACVGCGQCAGHCPYGNIKLRNKNGDGPISAELVALGMESERDTSLDLKATSCDLCHDHKQPNCVYACPHDAAERMTATQFREKLEKDSTYRRKELAP